MMRYGLDIGGSKMELVAFNAAMKPCWQHRQPTPTCDYLAFLSSVATLVSQADRQFTKKGSIGIGIAGIVDPDTRRQLASNIACLQGERLQYDLERCLQRPIHLANDSHCFTLSEALSGAAQQANSVFGVILGTGAGGGLVLGKQLYTGRTGMVGEWGHLAIAAPLIAKYQLPLLACNCGLQGCYEQYVSGSGLLKLSRYFDHPVADIPSLLDEYRHRQPKALAIFHCFIDILAAALAGLQTTLDVEAFVLGGGLSNIPEIYQLVPDAMSEWLLPLAEPAPILAPQWGDSSGVRGAALLAAQT